MLLIKTATLTIAFCLSAANAHMSLKEPPSLGYFKNKLVTNPDSGLSSPISKAQFPCKGYHKDPARGAGKSVVTWAAGSTQKFSLEGTATHNGGSCQLSLSYDNGASFRVIKSFIGGCPDPANAGKEFSFSIPREAASGAAIFAWTWYNHTGNLELYMGCAAVTITGGGSGLGSSSAHPLVFVANLGGQCATVPETDVEFPNPGAVVARTGKGTKPVGSGCA